MNKLIHFSLALLLAPCILASCANAQNSDFSSDEIVIEHLEMHKKKEFLKDEVCIKRFKESAEVIVIGFLDSETGCQLAGVFVNSRYYEKGDFELSKNALDALGWKTADWQQREELAGIWVKDGLMAFSASDYQRHKNPKFLPPKGVLPGGDEIQVIMLKPSVPGRTSRGSGRKVFTFNKDGSLISESGN